MLPAHAFRHVMRDVSWPDLPSAEEAIFRSQIRDSFFLQRLTPPSWTSSFTGPVAGTRRFRDWPFVGLMYSSKGGG